MKSIFVTGGAGFIGSHTSLLLLEKGYVVFILDSFVNSCQQSIENIEIILKEKFIDTKGKIYLIKGDLKNPSDIEKVFQLSSKLEKNIEVLKGEIKSTKKIFSKLNKELSASIRKQLIN